MTGKIINSVDAVCSRIDAVVGIIAFCALLTMITAISMQIVFRVYFQALPWSEELSRYMLVWLTFLGATMAYRRGLHITVTFVVGLLPDIVRRLIRTATIAASIFFFAAGMWYALSYIEFQSGQVTASLRLPIPLIYSVMPFSFAVMILYGLHALLLEMFPGHQPGYRGKKAEKQGQDSQPRDGNKQWP